MESDTAILYFAITKAFLGLPYFTNFIAKLVTNKHFFVEESWAEWGQIKADFSGFLAIIN